MAQIKRSVIAFLMGIVMTLALVFGVALSLPAAKAKAETLPTTGWTLAYEGTHRFRIQNGNTYWSENTNSVTTASMLDYTEINGKTLTEINEETPGAVSVTLQPAGGSIGSFYRVNIDTEISGFTVDDIGTVVIRSGWSHTDGSGTYTIDTDLYFAHGQNKWASDSSNWKYIPKENVVDISDAIQLDDQGIQAEGTRAILLKTSNNNYWTGDPITPNEGGGSFLNMLYINGTSIKEWNKKAHAALEAGEITDISYGSEFWLVDNGPSYAPIAVSNSAYIDGLGSISQIWIPTGYIDNVASFKIAKGFANLQGDTLYYVSKDLEYAKSGGSFTKISSTVDISDAFHLLVQDYTASDGTMLYYLHTNDVKYWTAQYGTAEAYAINESEWKGVSDSTLQGGAVQMSFLEFNGTPIYDINANDNGAYGATQSNIASGSKYAPILAFLTPKELGSAIKLQVPSQYPSGSGAAADNHQTITIKRGFFVVDTTTNIKYEVTRDIQWDYENGVWNEHVEKIYTTVDEAKLVWDDGAFVAISLTGDKYADASNTWAGDMATALSYAKSSNFYNYVLLNGEVITEPAEAFLNVWSNYGYFTFRTHGFSSDVASGINEITIKAGCQIPTYNALATGVSEVYVVTEDVTFIKDGNGDWVKDDGYIDAGEYATGVKSINYARDGKSNWMLIGLTEKDYPSAATVYNVATTEEQMSVLNLYDKIIVDGYTLRSRISQYGNPIEAPKINLWQASCLGVRISGAAGALDGAQKVTIRAGAQFPSYAYIMGGVEAYYVTSEEYTFVNVGAASGEWERQYTAKFVAEGETVETVEYLVSQGLPYIPEVPEKDGYAGRWENYTANGNITVNAVYTERTFAYEKTNVKTLYDQDGFMIISLTNHDFPYDKTTYSGEYTTVIPALKALNFEGYVFVDGKEMKLGGDGYMNVWGAGNRDHISFYINGYPANNMPKSITLKKGAQFPSYAYLSEGTKKCYELTQDVTYEKVDGVWQRVGEAVEDTEDVKPSGFANHYTLSDLYDVAESKSDCFKDGWETLTDKGATEESYRYGYLDNFQDFTLTFDFSFTGAAYYNTFNVQLGTEDYGGNKGHFGWRFYLLRGDSEKGTVTQDICVEYFSATCDHDKYANGNIKNDTFGREAFQAGRTYRITIGYQLIDDTKGTVRFYAAIDGIGVYNEAELGGDFATFAPYLQSLTMSTNTAQTVTVSDPSYEGNFENVNKLTLNANGKAIVETYTNGYVLPALSPEDYGMGGNVFVGWTTDTANLSNLYPAGHTYAPNGNETLYAVWLGFKMQNGAGVRIDESKPSGIRFLIDVDQAGYELGVSKGLIKGIGTIIAPTSYLTDNELTHALGAGYYIERSVDTWQRQNASYSVALVGISADQYARSFSARGYLKVQYTTGEGYIYTSYNEADHARSIYDVATSAYNDDKKDYKNNEAILGYVNAVADVTVSDDLASVTKNGVGNYTVSAAKNGDIFTLTVNNPVKAVVINGTRIMMGYDADVVIGGMRYTVSGFALNIGGTTISFAIGEGNEQAAKKYYISLLENWKNRTDYTAEHYAKICSVADKAIADIENGAKATWKEIYETAVATLETVKTGAELAENVGESTLATPVAARGDGYAVTWNAVENADYYIVSDTNDYRDYVVVYAGETLSYRAEVVGEHEVSVTAYSYYDSYRTSAASNAVATPEVKQAFSYKALSDGLYKFSSSQMSTMGISTTNCYYDSDDEKYFAYYNVDTKSWSPYPSMATDWSSPKYFLAHAKRLKEMGNNVILIPYGTNAMFREGEVWETSRLKYVMDTAWSIGMKIIVCDEVLYDLSMSDGSGTGATSKAQVTSAIGASKGFYDYIKHPAFYGFSFDDEPYGKYLSAMSYTIQAIDEACDAVEVYPFYLACLFQAQGGELGTEIYLTQSSLEEYYNKWLAIFDTCGIAKVKKYLYVDIYTQHAMGQPTNRYNTSFEVVYSDSYLGGKYDFYQALTAHTQNNGTLLEQDLYVSMMYGAAHDIKGYSWFCYFPITGELAGSLAGYDGEGYGNGKGNKNETGKCYYDAAKIAAKQFELIQGWLYGYDWKTRSFDVSGDKLTTTLSNGSNTATMYVCAPMGDMSGSWEVDSMSGKTCYLIGYGVGTADQPYEEFSGSVTLQPGQAVLCV